MGTVADKLNKVLSTKDDIKAAIIEKGQTVADTDTFASYTDKIRAIETGPETCTLTVSWWGSSIDLICSYADKSMGNNHVVIVHKNITDESSTSISDISIGDSFLIDGPVEIEYDEDMSTDLVIRYASSSAVFATIIGSNPYLSLYKA